MKKAAGFALGLACALALNCAGAQQIDAAAAPPPPPDVAAVAGDAWITTRIKAALVPLVRERRATVGVEVVQGMVVLSGTVEGEVTRQQIIALCAQTRGVASVDADALKIAGFPAPR